jgi:hypothetical protein
MAGVYYRGALSIGTQQPRGFSLIPPNQIIAIAKPFCFPQGLGLHGKPVDFKWHFIRKVQLNPLHRIFLIVEFSNHFTEYCMCFDRHHFVSPRG